MSETIKLNDRYFEFDCSFINATSDDKSYPLSPISYNCFEYIEIVDNMFSPFLDCNFAIQNPLNFIEKQPGTNPFKFSANNRNLCNINLTPVETKDSDNSYISKSNVLNVFGALDEGAISSSNNSEASILTFSLIDSKLASLLEVKIGHVYPKIQTNITISENIKNILQQIHLNDEVIGSDFNLGAVGGAQITTNYPFPLHYNLYDAIQFLLPFNVAIVNNIESQLFLKYNYDSGTYSNYSIYDMFNKATTMKVNQETFILGGKEGAETDIQDFTHQQPTNNIITKTFKDNILHNVSFSNINYKISNKELLPIYYTSTTDPTNINTLSYIDLESSMKLFETNVLNTASMKSLYGDANIKLNVDLDESKVGQQNYKIISTPFTGNINEKIAKAQLYSSFIFQNMSLSFTCLGQPYRQAGVFINIARASDTVGVEFDKKLLGQWLVTDVTHIIQKGKYTTRLQCVKPFRVG